MARQQNSRNELRIAFANRELKYRRFNFPAGSTGVFMQATLALIYMALIFIGYMLMGTAGLVGVALLFILALCFPLLQMVRTSSASRRAPDATASTGPQTQAKQEG